MSVCPVVGGLLQPNRDTLMGVPFPCTTIGWHHVAPLSENYYAVPPCSFDQKNYGTRTDTARGHSFRLLRPISTPTENPPLTRLDSLEPVAHGMWAPQAEGITQGNVAEALRAH